MTCKPSQAPPATKVVQDPVSIPVDQGIGKAISLPARFSLPLRVLGTPALWCDSWVEHGLWKLGLVAQACNPSTQQPGTGGCESSRLPWAPY